MPRPYPPEFLQRAVVLVHARKAIPAVARGLAISAGCLRFRAQPRPDLIQGRGTLQPATQRVRPGSMSGQSVRGV